MSLSVADIAQKGAKQMEKVTGLAMATLVGVDAAEGGWRVKVELVEQKTIPPGMDVLGLYEARLDASGNLLSFERHGLRKRMDTDVNW